MIKVLGSSFLVTISVFAFIFSWTPFKNFRQWCNQSYASSFSEYKVGGAEYESKNICAVNISWTGGNITITESDDDVLSFKENSYGEELSEEQKLHWCVKSKDDNKEELNIFAERPSVVTKIRQKRDLPKKDLTVYVPRKLEKVSLDLVNSNCEFKNGTANKVNLNGVSSVLRLSPVNCEEINVDGVGLNLEVKPENNIGAIVCRNGVFNGMVGKDKKIYGEGKIQINLEGVNNRYKII